jgi:hypothetical protein
MVLRMPSAPDFELGSEWRCSVATTSSTVSGLPFEKVTPLRILKTHFLAPSEASQLSASQGPAVPSFGLGSTRHSPQKKLTFCITTLADNAGSSVSEDDPPLSPEMKCPPLTGAACAAVARSCEAKGAATPSAAARPMKSRRLMSPRATRKLRSFSSSDMSPGPPERRVFVVAQFDPLSGGKQRLNATITAAQTSSPPRAAGRQSRSRRHDGTDWIGIDAPLLADSGLESALIRSAPREAGRL